MKTLKTLIISDLHINFSDMKAQDDVDLVIISGDVGPNIVENAAFLKKFKKVPKILYVLGNHEFEKKDLYQFSNSYIKFLSHEVPNLEILDNRTIEYQGIRFIGTTLWSDFKLYEPRITTTVAMELANNQILDYKTIIGKYGKLMPSETLELHNVAINFIETELKKLYFGKTVVISHFCPHPKSIDVKYEDEPLNGYFCSNLERLMNKSEFWLHGHTHSSFNYFVGKTNVVCNPRGYSNGLVNENKKFNPNLIIDLLK